MPRRPRHRGAPRGRYRARHRTTFTDAPWARVVGICLAAVSTVVSFLYIPYAPAWSVIVIAIDVLVIWALASPRRGWA